ncbi:MAG: hypothetical protein LRY36_00280 [Alphaproteobacteria bacterium]|nr:hypothetical protein [Alphaproteobacteria bacterium]
MRFRGFKTLYLSGWHQPILVLFPFRKASDLPHSVYGRVAVAYVQGLPKGHRAVTEIAVLNTRLPEITSGGFFLNFKTGD